jgi:UTP--glucose-1-phosphate uridylyltransferase
MDIDKVIIPAAGLGTRFFPLCKTIPKELLPVLTKPALQIVMEEALASSLNNFVVITRHDKNISHLFDPAPGLQALLRERHQEELLGGIQRIIRTSNISYIHQNEPLGLGHALWLARHLMGKEYCAIMLPDDLIISDQPAIGQLMRIARQEKASVIAVQEVPDEELCNYGVITIKKQITPNLYQVANIIEKPQPHEAASNLAVVGRYVLSYKLFAALEQLSTYAKEELQLTDAITTMLHSNERVFAYKIYGTRYDIGQPLGWLKANLGYALNNSNYREPLKAFLASYEIKIKDNHDIPFPVISREDSIELP